MLKLLGLSLTRQVAKDARAREEAEEEEKVDTSLDGVPDWLVQRIRADGPANVHRG